MGPHGAFKGMLFLLYKVMIFVKGHALFTLKSQDFRQSAGLFFVSNQPVFCNGPLQVVRLLRIDPVLMDYPF
jgi:hypothetical protein